MLKTVKPSRVFLRDISNNNIFKRAVSVTMCHDTALILFLYNPTECLTYFLITRIGKSQSIVFWTEFKFEIICV